MTLTQNTLEGQTAGVAVTKANSAASGAAFTAITQASGAVIEYTDASPMHGTRCLHFLPVTGGGAAVVLGGYNAASGVSFFYIKFGTMPAATTMMGQLVNTAGATMAKLYVNGSGRLVVNDSAATLFTAAAATAMTAGTWYRWEAEVIAGTSTTNGTVSVAVYVGDSTTPLASFTSTTANTGTVNYANAQFGKTDNGTFASDFWIDDLGQNDGATAFNGPTSSGSSTPALAGGSLSVTPLNGTSPLTVTATASGVTGGTGTSLLYTFIWGDNTTTGPQTSATATHTYAAAGNYPTSFTVANS